MTTRSAPTATYELLAKGALECGSRRRLSFTYRPAAQRAPGSRLWMFYGIRQNPGVPQHMHPARANHLSASASGGNPVRCEAYLARSLDLYPRLPEFLHVCEMGFPAGLPPGETVTIHLGGTKALWQVPTHPIERFRFWFLESSRADQEFRPTGYKTYREFSGDEDPQALQERVADVETRIEGEFPRPSPANTRPTPGILWGDIHGMAFNQRPLDDFYRYARDIAQFDFAAALLFSYNTCVRGVWKAVKDAAARWTEPGCFVGIVGVESGTVPDGSHRNAYFFEPGDVPPIFCEDRPPANQARLTKRFSEDTIFCRTLDDYYDAVGRYGGIVTGHFHTWRYNREILAEIWQKQLGPEGDEERIFGLLNEAFHLGIVAGSDTHDSMPGNPEPEPYCPQSAGFMAVLAEEVSGPAIREAMVRRRVYGTTGARIALRFESAGGPMGSILPADAPRRFEVQAEGSAPLSGLELIRDGQVVRRTRPSAISIRLQWDDADPDCRAHHWYIVKATQVDGHRAWSSPIWFE